MRLDQYLVEKGFFESRNKAKTAIDEGHISINDKIITKSSYNVLDTDTIKIVGDVCPYVSRGGYKLLAAIKSLVVIIKVVVIKKVVML